MNLRRLSACCFTLFAVTSPLCAQTSVSYARDVRPFLAKYCLECHNAKNLKGKLNLESYQGLMKGSSSGEVVVPGKADESALVLLVESKDQPKMPPKEARLHPKPKEIAVLRVWVAAGAKDDSAEFKITLPPIKPTVPVAPPVAALAYRSDDKALAAAGQREVLVLDPASGAIINGVWKLDGNVTALAYRPGSDSLAVAYGTTGVRGVVGLHRILNTNVISSGHLRDFHGHADVVLGMDFCPDGKTLATCSYDRTVKLWDTDTGKLLHTLKEHSDAVYGVAFHKDGKLLATGAADRAVKVWDADTAKLLYTLGEATDWVYSVAWSPDGKHLAAAGVDRSIRVWEASAAGARLVHSVFAHEAPVTHLVYSADGKTLYSLAEDRVVKAWDAGKMVERKVYARQPETVLALAVRHDQKQLALGRYDGALLLVDEKSGAVQSQPLPAKPKANKVSPAAGQRGIAWTVTVDGKDLHDIREAALGVAGATARVLPEGRSPTRVQVELQLPPTTPAGVYALTLKDGHGQATTLNFIVDLFPLVSEQEPNNSPGTGQTVKLPVSIAGSLQQTGDVDWFRFDAAAGQQVGVQILTKEIGSKIDPFLELVDAAGKVLAKSNDGVLGHTFAKAGTYALGVRDREYRGGADMAYRLHVGPIPVVTSVYPLGMQKGTTGIVQLDGVFLDQQTAEVKADGAVGSKLPINLKTKYGTPLGKLSLLVDEFPEVLAGKTNALPVPGTGNGKISESGATEVWRFHAKKGDRLILEVNARRLGSPLDSFIEILDAKGNLVPRATLRSLARTFVTFRDHDSASAGIRIEAWGELAVNDYILVGNELLKIKALPPNPDADCTFFSERIQRIGYLDTTPTHHAQGTPMYKVSIHPPGTQFAPNGFPVVTLYYRNDDGGPGYGRDSKLFFEAPADGDYQVRIGDSRGQGGPHFAYRLTVRPPRPNYNVSFTPQSPAVWKGGAIPITVNADRLDGFDGPIHVKLDNLPPGFSAPTTTIPAGENSTAFALYAEAGATAPTGAAKLKLVARATIDGKEVVKEAMGGMASLQKDNGDIVTTTEQSSVTLKPGGTVRLLVKVQRQNGFKGRIPLDVRGLPHGVRVLDIGLNGILVTENETVRSIEIFAEPWVEAIEQPFVVLARREGKNSEHAAKSVLLKVVK
jgi:WD40 repeat protein